MPSLSSVLVEQLEKKLTTFLANRPGYKILNFVASGGSAAVFKVNSPFGLRGIKIFDPKFLLGAGAASEKRRLKLQESLSDHTCEHLVKIFSVTCVLETAFIEMEWVDSPQLKSVLKNIPDDEIPSIISQLVSSIQYLEGRGIIHRDIKSENIHLSEDFKKLKLLDLGVARTVDESDGEEGAITDHGNVRPFLATAQYSPPEYLFRLDEPTSELWRALNFYQVGAVLYDLIQKDEIFKDEISLGNRWLVSKAVLLKTPVFTDGTPQRLSYWKSLALRCLTKDMNTRLEIVNWTDFSPVSGINPLDMLKARPKFIGHPLGTDPTQLNHEKSEYGDRLLNFIKDKMIDALTGKSRVNSSTEMRNKGVYFMEFEAGINNLIVSQISLQWKRDLYESTCDILFGAWIQDSPFKMVERPLAIVGVGILKTNEMETFEDLSQKLAQIVIMGFEIIEGASFNIENHIIQIFPQEVKS